MSTKREKIALDEYYHIYNRENHQQDIFYDERDWVRFLCLILYCQSTLPIENAGRMVSRFIKYQKFTTYKTLLKKVLQNRTTELVNFTLMSNHFHLILHEIKEGGTSKYMQRIQDSHTKYINTKYGKSGHLFQGVFQRVRVTSNEQLLHLSAYIHRNQRELKPWKNKEYQYPWSSYQDCVGKNRWGELLKPQIITEQFSNPDEYKEFVETSGTKLLDEEHLL